MALPQKITEEQQELLIDYLETHRRMITGKLDNSVTYKDHAKLWEDVTKKLNSCAGAKKTATNWRKSWQDMKRNVKEKYGRIRGHRRRTGGGKATTEKLTPQQEMILALMGPTVVTGHPLIEESAVEEVNASVEEQQDTTGASLVNLIVAPHNLPVLADSNVLNPDDGILSSPAGPSNVNIGLSQTSSLEDSFATEPSRSFVTAAKPAAPSKKRKGSSAYTPATKAAEVLSSFKERELELRQREVEVQELFVREGLAILREGLAFVRESEERKATAMENIAAALASIASAQQQQ